MNMKCITLTFTVGIALFAALAGSLAAQEQEHHTNQAHYTVQTLGSLGGTSCCGVSGPGDVLINDRGWVDGTSNLAGNQNFHPFLWISGQMRDLGTLGGPNASAGGMNEVGDVTVGGSDTGIRDPLGEDFCSFGTYQICLSFVWHRGQRILIPTLGGNNNDVNTINNNGQVLAFAETAVHDPTCVAPQVLGFEAFTWEPKSGEIHTLPPLTGDSDSVGFWMNENGEVAGASGICADVSLASALHIALWKNGIPSDLGSLGGATGNAALGINNRGQVVGISDLPGDATFHGFLWQNGTLTDLGTLPGDFASVASSINDDGQIAMESCDINFNCRAAVWQNGVMTDLNTLIPPDSPFFLLLANSINSRGQIVGAALDQSTSAIVPFLAIPCNHEHADTEGCKEGAEATITAGERPKVALPESVREQLRHRKVFGRFGLRQ
jgi:probable HAF family extracellular repeat protein